MPTTAVFHGSKNVSVHVKKNLRDQSSSNVACSRTHRRFENDHSSSSTKYIEDEGGIMSTRDWAMSVTELTEETAFELGLHLLPASMASYLLRQAKQGSCPPLPILRVLGICT
jgi:hypothetical protein